MNRQEYNRMIEETLKTKTAQTGDALATARAVLNHMGISLPQGDLKQVSEALATDDYMGWRKCTVKEAQEYANNGTAVVGVSDERIAVVAANDEEGEVAADSAAVMTLSESTSALSVSDTAFYASRAGSTTSSSKERVTIMYDQNQRYAKVVFGSSGKVWHCIHQDLIYENNVPSFLYNRSRYNLYVDGESGEFQDYSIAEMKLLYAIDPYGFAYYIKNFAERAIVDTSLAGILAYKDLIFGVLFGREPKYFARDINGEWYRTLDTSDLTHVLSESEVYFGMHALWDWVTYQHMIAFGIDVLTLIFNTSLFKSSAILENVKSIYLTGVMICSVGEAILKNEILSYAAGSGIENALSNTNLDWVSKVTTIIGGINDITASLTAKPNYCDKIIAYCVDLNQFSIYVQSTNGQTYTLQSISNALN